MYISTKYSVNGEYREGQVAYVHCAIGSFYQDQIIIWNLFLDLKLAGIESKLIQRKILKFKKNPSPAQILILAQGAKFLIIICIS